jgi:hypothetical protein
MKEIEIDMNRIPRNIGKIRDEFRDYTAVDVPKILDWINSQLPGTDEIIKVIITGRIPLWIGLKVGHHLEGTVDIFGYTTPAWYAPYIVYDLPEEFPDRYYIESE